MNCVPVIPGRRAVVTHMIKPLMTKKMSTPDEAQPLPSARKPCRASWTSRCTKTTIVAAIPRRIWMEAMSWRELSTVTQPIPPASADPTHEMRQCGSLETRHLRNRERVSQSGTMAGAGSASFRAPRPRCRRNRHFAGACHVTQPRPVHGSAGDLLNDVKRPMLHLIVQPPDILSHEGKNEHLDCADEDDDQHQRGPALNAVTDRPGVSDVEDQQDRSDRKRK